MRIALDATYSLGRNLSGVGFYSREMMFGLAKAHPDQKFLYCYRSQRFLRSFKDSLPRNASRRLLSGLPHADVFHALNQRVNEKESGKTGPRVVTTFHDLFVITGDYSSLEFRARFTQQAKEAAERSDAIIAVSQFTADQVEHLLNVERSRIHVVHHGVTVLDQPQPDSPRENLILFVGAIQRRKNVARLVQAFGRMPFSSRQPWRLVLAGAADGFGAAEELAAVEASPCRSRIDVLGYVTSAQLKDLYARASVFAFASLDEGFGMPVLEAMAHGIPVVTSSISALPEVAGDAALLVDPQDVDAIASALTRLTEDADLRADLIRRGRQHVDQFTWNAAVQKTWDVYRTLIP